MKKSEFFSLFFLFCGLWAGFADFHDAGTGIVGLDYVENDSILPFGADFAVDDSFDVAVFGVAAAVDDSQYAEACDE